VGIKKQQNFLPIFNKLCIENRNHLFYMKKVVKNIYDFLLRNEFLYSFKQLNIFF